jgi:hypothetical protein
MSCLTTHMPSDLLHQTRQVVVPYLPLHWMALHTNPIEDPTTYAVIILIYHFFRLNRCQGPACQMA